MSLSKWNALWDDKTIRLIEVNGAFYAADDESKQRLESTGLQCDGFLSYDLVLSHVSKHGFCLETEGGVA